MLDNEVYLQGMRKIIALFPEKKIEVNVFYEFFSKMSENVFMGAIDYLITKELEIRQSTNLVALILKNASLLKFSSTDDAWIEVLDQIKKVGSWGEPKFSNKLIAKAIGVNGGWKRYCGELTNENMPFEKKRFVEAYEDLKDVEMRKENTLEIENKPKEIRE